LAEFDHLALEECDPILGAAPVDFEFGLAGTAAADTARQSGEGAGALLRAEPRQEIAKLGELNLDLTLAGLSALRENIQDDLCTIKDFEVREFRERIDLSRGEILVKYQGLRSRLHCLYDRGLKAALAHHISRIDRTSLDYFSDNVNARGARQVAQLGHRVGHIRRAIA
jgi:hypothetical protein